ncbi:class I SAM-dependent methyltransferase, partial [bacterium]|nr:class I SAM-dependent methyltransferase [bacterium]
GLEHVNMFHPESLAVLLERCGFTVESCATPGRLDADLVRQQILDGRFDAVGHPFLRRVLVEDWDRLGGPFQGFLRDHGLSSNMVVTARRGPVASPGGPS